MKVLLAAKFSPDGRRPMGGVQSWIDTVRRQLVKRDYQVETWDQTMLHGQFPTGWTDGMFDLGIFANYKHTKTAERFCKRVGYVCHGIIEAERPALHARTVYVSEGVKAAQAGANGYGAIVRQPIDLDFWSPGPSASPSDHPIAVRFSYRQSDTLCEAAMVHFNRHVTGSLPWRYEHVYNATPDVARNKLRRASLAFATGRAALEAMACGVPVVLYDHRSAYQRPLLGRGLASQMAQSYSGRGGIEFPTVEQVVEEMQHALDLGPAYFRQWVTVHHRAGNIVADLLGQL